MLTGLTNAFDLQSGSVSAILGGTIGLTKSTAGTVTLTGANTYSGTTTISGGTLLVGNGTSGSLNGAGALTFTASGAINFSEAAGSSQGMGALTFSAGDSTVTSTFVGTSATLTFSNLVARAAGATGNFVAAGGDSTTNKIVLTKIAGVTPTTGTLLDKGYFFGGANYAAYDATTLSLRAFDYGADSGAVIAPAAATLGAVASTSNVQMTGAISAQTTAAVNTVNVSGAFDLTLDNADATVSDGQRHLENGQQRRHHRPRLWRRQWHPGGLQQRACCPHRSERRYPDRQRSYLRQRHQQPDQVRRRHADPCRGQYLHRRYHRQRRRFDPLERAGHSRRQHGDAERRYHRLRLVGG